MTLLFTFQVVGVLAARDGRSLHGSQKYSVEYLCLCFLASFAAQGGSGLDACLNANILEAAIPLLDCTAADFIKPLCLFLALVANDQKQQLIDFDGCVSKIVTVSYNL